jgi:hypothetical protein
MDLSRLSRGEQILGGAGIALLVLSVLPFWSKYESAVVLGGSARTSIWHAAFNFLPKFGMFMVLLALVLLITRMVSPDLQLPVPAGLAYVVLFGIATLCLLIALISGPYGAGQSGPGYEISRGPFLFIGWLIAAAGAYGGYLHMQEEGSAPVTTTTTAPPPSGPPPPTAP